MNAVARDKPPASAKHTAPIKPLPQSVRDDDLVPVGPFGFDRDKLGHAQIEVEIARDVGNDRSNRVRVER